MAVKRSVNGRFVYIAYKRDGYRDFDKFKRELENSGSVNYADKDIIIDFTGSNCISSPEIGELIRLLKNLRGTSRFLRCILTESIEKMIRNTNIHKLDNLVIYKDQQTFINEIQKSAAPAV